MKSPRRGATPRASPLLVFGGSQGARAVNEAVVAALPHLAARRDVLRVTHQTGKLDFEKVRAGYEAAGWGDAAEVREYIDDMVAAFAAADLIVSRAGATTSFELMAAGKAALMVPLPGQLEQRRNAEVMQEAGAARMILQAELSGERLAREIARAGRRPRPRHAHGRGRAQARTRRRGGGGGRLD